MPRYVTKTAYAALCGVTYQAIQQRIAKGFVQLIMVPGPTGPVTCIDTNAYPPVPRQAWGELKDVTPED